ncbi:MAG: cytochrome c biogenesis protein CcdA [bacterium]
MEQQISILVAFLAGVLSFFSPCVLPLIPAYICFITGLSMDKLMDSSIKSNTKKILGNILLFILGFSIIFIALGASATSVGSVIIKNQKILRAIGGIVIIIFGLHIVGLFKIKFLEYEKRIHLKDKPVLGGFGSLIVGMTFAVGWTPCIGPIFGSILTLAATKKTLSQGILLLSSYSFGLALPFLITGLAVDRVLKMFSKVKRFISVISVFSGVVLIIIGILILFGRVL